jgi:cell division protein FtsW (lipid II flippase)
MIVLGVILLIIGFLANISILWTIGIALVVIGAVLALVGGTGRKIGGRAHWF